MWDYGRHVFAAAAVAGLACMWWLRSTVWFSFIGRARPNGRQPDRLEGSRIVSRAALHYVFTPDGLVVRSTWDEIRAAQLLPHQRATRQPENDAARRSRSSTRTG